mmetsp:Transcript_23380/g.70041  ORF Transcript_23380/g.70041 Transcript_23380/m.70041 type:complete len:304 (+) Transcript_23380:13-924(+)
MLLLQFQHRQIVSVVVRVGRVRPQELALDGEARARRERAHRLGRHEVEAAHRVLGLLLEAAPAVGREEVGRGHEGAGLAVLQQRRDALQAAVHGVRVHVDHHVEAVHDVEGALRGGRVRARPGAKAGVGRLGVAVDEGEGDVVHAPEARFRGLEHLPGHVEAVEGRDFGRHERGHAAAAASDLRAGLPRAAEGQQPLVDDAARVRARRPLVADGVERLPRVAVARGHTRHPLPLGAPLAGVDVPELFIGRDVAGLGVDERAGQRPHHLLDHLVALAGRVAQELLVLRLHDASPLSRCTAAAAA